MEKKISADIEFGLNISETEIENIKTFIAKKDEKSLEIAIKRIPLRKMKFEMTTSLLVQLLNHLELYSFTPGLKIILNYWSGMETGFDEYEGETYPVIPSLFLDHRVPFRNLYYLMEALRDVISVLEVAIELFEKGSGESLSIALRNLFEMVGEPSGELYRTLYDEANNSGNRVAIDFVSDLQTFYVKPAEKPSYIFNITGDEGESKEEEEELTEESDLIDVANDVLETDILSDIPFEDVEFCSKYLTAGLKRFGIEVVDVESTEKAIREKLEKLTLKQREEYMSSFLSQDMMDKMYENEILFQILGPVNPLVNGDFSQMKHVCFKYGGCRMFFCNCFESEILAQDQETDSTSYYPNIPQWFTGKCQKCKRKINKRCYSVRRPLPQGGWRGTYCSWNCIHLSGDVDDELSINYSDMVEKRMYVSGITDRIEPDVEELLKQAREDDPEGYQYKPPVLK